MLLGPRAEEIAAKLVALGYTARTYPVPINSAGHRVVITMKRKRQEVRYTIEAEQDYAKVLMALIRGEGPEELEEGDDLGTTTTGTP